MSERKRGNMIGMVCSDGIVVACLKQFKLEFDKIGELKDVVPKQDSEYDKLVVTGNIPQVVLCGIGGAWKLCPVMNMVANKVCEANGKSLSRPSIEELSKDCLQSTKSCNMQDAVHLFVAGGDQDLLGNWKLSLKYVNHANAIEVPKMYIIGFESHFLRTQIGHFENKTSEEAIELIKFGFACVARKEKDLEVGYIEGCVINLKGEVEEFRFDDLDLMVGAYCPPNEAQDGGDANDEDSDDDSGDGDIYRNNGDKSNMHRGNSSLCFSDDDQ